MTLKINKYRRRYRVDTRHRNTMEVPKYTLKSMIKQRKQIFDALVLL